MRNKTLLMSVKENFSSKEDETNYFKALYKMVYLLQKNMKSIYQNGQISDLNNTGSVEYNSFCHYFKKFYSILKFYDYKIHPYPKYSFALNELYELIEDSEQNLVLLGYSSNNKRNKSTPFCYKMNDSSEIFPNSINYSQNKLKKKLNYTTGNHKFKNSFDNKQIKTI